MNLGRPLKLSAMMVALVPLLIGCGGSDDPTPAAGATSTAGASKGTDLLSKVFYNGKLADEYTYDEAGKPLTHVHYHPVTGAKSSVLTVTKVDGAGRVTEASNESGSTTTKVVYEYDGDGRRTSITRFDAGGNQTSKSTYAHDGNVITQTSIANGRNKTKLIYTLDSSGNVVSQRWIDGSRDQTHKFSDFDTKPNPRTLTALMHDEYPIGRNNYRSDVTYAGCVFTSVHKYDGDGLLIQTNSTGCTGPNGSPTKHQFRYEYLTL